MVATEVAVCASIFLLMEFVLVDEKQERLPLFLSRFEAHGLPAIFDFDIVGLAVVTFGTRRKKERGCDFDVESGHALKFIAPFVDFGIYSTCH